MADLFTDPMQYLNDAPIVGDILPGQSSTQQADQRLVQQQRQNADRYRQYRPEAMQVRRETLQQALQMFSPLAQFVSQNTGMQAPDMQAMFAPLENAENRVRTQNAASAPAARQQQSQAALMSMQNPFSRGG